MVPLGEDAIYSNFRVNDYIRVTPVPSWMTISSALGVDPHAFMILYQCMLVGEGGSHMIFSRISFPEYVSFRWRTHNFHSKEWKWQTF